jgi:L-lactate dehydrogenase (cytochrome)
VWRDRASVRELVAQAREHGYDTLVMTVDTPVPGGRLRDLRSGLTIPPVLTARALLPALRHSRWWFRLLTNERLTFGPSAGGGTVAELTARLFDPTLCLDDLVWLRETWPGRLAVKGVLSAEDARLVVEHGADAVVLSNHGGRQLDRVPVPLEALPAVREAVGGDAEVWLDGGIRTGADIVAALAMGADACLVGRAYLYGLMAGGEAGVDRVVDILRAEIVRTLHLLGVPSIADLTPRHATLRRSTW